MKKNLLILYLLAMHLLAFGQDDPSLLFKLGFDSYKLKADVAKGSANSFNCRGFETDDLQLRMHAGIPDSRNALCMTNEECIQYSNHGNFNPRRGTVSLWVCPKNWAPSTKGCFQIFFIANCPDGFKMVINKWNTGNILHFAIIKHEKEELAINVQMEDNVWKKESWHKIDAVWDETEMLLYVDGVLGKVTNYYCVFNPLKFKTAQHFPESRQGGSISFNDTKWWSHKKEDTTAYDEIEIHDRKLSAAEIQAAYLKRYPSIDGELPKSFLRIPLDKTPAIAIDGKLEEAAWGTASKVPMMLTMYCDPVKDKPHYGNEIYLKHDNKFLYLAANVMDGDIKAIAATRDEEALWKSDNSLELHFSDGKVRTQFIINANGVFWDGKGIAGQSAVPNGNVDWTSEIRLATAKTEKGWTLEAAIPLEELGVKGAGDEFTANFFMSYNNEKRIGMCWAEQKKEFFSDEYYARLQLGTDAQFCQIENSGSPLEGKWNLSMKASEGAYGSGTLEALGVKLSTSESLTQVPWEIELSGGQWKYSLSATNGSVKLAAMYGRFLYPASMSVLARGDIKNNRIRVNISLSGVYKEIAAKLASGEVKGLLTLQDQGGKIVRKVDFTPAATAEIQQFIPLGEDLPKGKYSITVKLESGTDSYEHSIKFGIPDLTPYKRHIMDNHDVYAPWTPVKDLGKNSYQVWNRIYKFDKAPLPAGIKFGGRDIFTKAPWLTLKTASGDEKIKWSEWKKDEAFDDVLKFSGQGTAQSARIRWQGELWFDGMWKLDFEISPLCKDVELSSLQLGWSMPKELVTAVINPYYKAWEGKKLEFVYNKGVDDFILWMTNPHLGFAWMPLDTANWQNKAGEKPIRVMPGENGTVCAEINYISKSVKLSGTAKYSMIMMATPSRPVANETRAFNLGHHSGWYAKPIDCENAKCNGHGNDRWSYKQGYTTHPWASLIPWNRENFAKYLEDLAKDGIKYMPYSQPAFVSSIEPEYDFFIDDWKMIPGIVTGGAYNYENGQRYDSVATCQEFGSADYFLALEEKCLNDWPALCGVYYDLCHVKQCTNMRHGHGGIDAFGQEYSSSTVLGLRHFLMRSWKFLHSRGKAQKIHAHHRFAPFAHAFCDYIVTGEQYNGVMLKNLKHFFCEDIPLGMYQTVYNAEATGMRFIFGSHLEMQPMFEPPQKWDGKYVRTPELTVMYICPMILHDISINGYYSNKDAIGQWWRIKQDCSLEKGDFNGYWENDAVKCGGDKVYASWYGFKDKDSKYRRVIVIANLGREKQPVKLQIDWSKFGLNPSGVKFLELVSGKELQDLSSLELEGNTYLVLALSEK